MALPAEFLQQVADAIGDAFDLPELNGIVLKSTGEGLFKEWVSEGKTHRVTAFELLVALGQQGLETLFLARVLEARPTDEKIKELITRAQPAVLEVRLETGKQVGDVLAGLRATRDKLQEPAVRQAVAISRDALASGARGFDTLAVYKNLHDCLHALQLKTFRDLKAAARRLAQDPDQASSLREFAEQLRTACTNAREWPDRLPADPTMREVELIWIQTLETAAEKLQSALDASAAPAIREALTEIRTVLRREPFRLNQLIYATAKSLPLAALTSALRQVSDAVGDGAAELTKAHNAMRDLGATVLGRVVEHKMWQDADNKIWHLEETFELAPDEALEDFGLAWPATKTSILSLAAMEPNALWAKNANNYSKRLDDELAKEELGTGLKTAFDAYRREARFRFFAVDRQLRSDCASLVRMGDPLHAILEGLDD
jgi:hypothetical protein